MYNIPNCFATLTIFTIIQLQSLTGFPVNPESVQPVKSDTFELEFRSFNDSARYRIGDEARNPEDSVHKKIEIPANSPLDSIVSRSELNTDKEPTKDSATPNVQSNFNENTKDTRPTDISYRSGFDSSPEHKIGPKDTSSDSEVGSRADNDSAQPQSRIDLGLSDTVKANTGVYEARISKHLDGDRTDGLRRNEAQAVSLDGSQDDVSVRGAFNNPLLIVPVIQPLPASADNEAQVVPLNGSQDDVSVRGAFNKPLPIAPEIQPVPASTDLGDRPALERK